MNFQNLNKNRIIMIIMVVVVIAGYVYIRENRSALEKRMGADPPPFLTKEFADSQMEKASEEDRVAALQLLEDADMYMKSRQYREAGSAYNRALALFPDGAMYYHYARYLYEMNKLSWMKVSLELAGELGFDEGLIAYETARLFGKLNKPFEAFENLKKAMETGSFSVETVEQEKAFDVIRKSVMTKQRYADFIQGR